uniref:Uncharacterized protein n=1 Tax=Opuntia streptacantha TaxID=393608 RepID=A0A7C8ZHQ5_OPUST
MERSDCETLCRGDEKFGKAKGGTEEAKTVGESEIKEASKEPKTAGSEIEERIGEGETVYLEGLRGSKTKARRRKTADSKTPEEAKADEDGRLNSKTPKQMIKKYDS